MGLKKSREVLYVLLHAGRGDTFKEMVLKDWPAAEALIEEWRKGLKAWEAKETFQRAYAENRMSVRSFSPDFGYELNKSIQDFAVVGTNRFRPTSDFSEKYSAAAHRRHSDALHDKKEIGWYNHPVRGMESKAFANKANFMSREARYKAGLHDLSASLLNCDLNFVDQVHHKDDGAYFAFLPLPEMEDQALLYKLICTAKEMKADAPRLYETVRALRAEITRVKLAAEFDMAIGYSAVPAANPVEGGPKYKLRYTLGATTKPVEGETADAKATAKDVTETMKLVDRETYQARQQAGIFYKTILQKAAARPDGKKNEIVIAIRHHGGRFPIYAKRVGTSLMVMDISGGTEAVSTQKLVMKGLT